MAKRNATTRGFTRTASLLQPRIRKAGEARGFAVTRLLTHWEEIVGPDFAAIARPVEVKYGRQGLGATLTVLTTGAQAPMLEMQKEALRDRVNAAYGYNAISALRITQTARSGFAEGRADFVHKPAAPKAAPPDPEVSRAAAELARPVGDARLRDALEALAQNVLSKSRKSPSA